MNVLVTGGSGFIGSNLCDFLVRKSHKVTVVDNLSTGKVSNLVNIINEIDFFEEEIEDFDFNKYKTLDAVIHLAAQPSVPLSLSDFKNSSISNLLGTIQVMNCCKQKKIPLIYASSSAIYGNLDKGNDASTKIDLLSPYAADKYAMEVYASAANKAYGLSSIGLRFFNVYGPRQDPSSPYSGVISIFIDLMLKGLAIQINGGYQTRDFIYVSDVVKLIYESLLISKRNVVSEKINVLTGVSKSIDFLADSLMTITGRSVQKIYRDLPIGDPEISSGCIDKMINLFNLDSSKLIQLDIGLKKTVDFINNSDENKF